MLIFVLTKLDIVGSLFIYYNEKLSYLHKTLLRKNKFEMTQLVKIQKMAL